MARKLPVVSGRATLRALQKAGFALRHVRGSHHMLMNPIGTLSAILDQAGLSAEEFMALL